MTSGVRSSRPAYPAHPAHLAYPTYNLFVERLDRTAVRAVRQLIADQPLTDKKVAFAWTLAAGPTLARASHVSWSDGVLRVEASTETWRRELARARPVLIKRIEELLGAGVVRTITVVLSSRAAASKAGRFSR